MEYGFAYDEEELLDDGTKCAITINRLLAHRSIKFDETELRLGSDKDNSGSRAKPHTNPNLNRSGTRHTRSSGHVTGGVAVNGVGEVLPPLIIFSSNAEKEETEDRPLPLTLVVEDEEDEEEEGEETEDATHRQRSHQTRRTVEYIEIEDENDENVLC